MTFNDFREFLHMVKEAEREMKPARFWALAVTIGGGWLAYGVAKLIESLR